MERVASSRAHLLGVLRRRPVIDLTADPSTSIDVRRVNQVRELLSLVDRGLLSEEEFEQQYGRLFGD